MERQEKTYVRFSVDQRVEHIVLIVSFFVLGLTGLPQKFPLSPISEFFFQILGGIDTIRFIHRFSAFVMMIQSLFHVLSVGYRLFVLKTRAGMLPSTQDVFDAARQFGYNLGLVKEPPKMDRFNFIEKAEYWALVWGTLIMGITGFMLWNPIATTELLPGQIIPAAKAAHGAEAILAVLAILLWHFYHVHIREWNPSIFTGRMSRHQMKEEHAAELERIETGAVAAQPPPEARERRQMIFFPFAAVFTLGFLFLVFFFTNYEQTSITTLPPAEREVEAFSPQTSTPFATPTFLPTTTVVPGGTDTEDERVLTWETAIQGLLQENCTGCHGQLGGLSLESYDALLTGGTNGPAVVPGDPESGTLVSVMESGDHPALLSEEELALVREWISMGAPIGEEDQTASSGEETVDLVELNWENEIGELFELSCSGCHGDLGGLNVETYDALLDGGVSGSAIVPGEPDEGTLIPLMQSGDHFAFFEGEQLEWLVAWIENDAPEE